MGLNVHAEADTQTEEQQLVFDSTVRRGYLTGWSMIEFAARQVVKAIEELAELSTTVGAQDSHVQDLLSKMQDVGNLARLVFDDSRIKWDCDIDHDAFCKELADLQVTVFNAAEAIAKASDTPYNSARAAVEKAHADIKRGVRKS